jgi:hypothetical protein
MKKANGGRRRKAKWQTSLSLEGMYGVTARPGALEERSGGMAAGGA